MEAADEGMEVVDASEPLGLLADVDDLGVRAAGEYDEALAGDVGDERLIVEDERIGCPAAVAARLVDGEALLEAAASVDLAGDEHRSVQQKRRLPALGLRPASVDVTSARHIGTSGPVADPPDQ